MTPLRDQRRYALRVAIAAAISLAVVGAVGWMVHSRRTIGEDATAEAATGSVDARQSVQLARNEIVSAAGIEVVPVESRPLETTLACNGYAMFDQNRYVKVPPKADGILSKIHVDVGATVQAGQVLAEVSSQTVGDLKASYLKALVHEEHLRWQVERFRSVGEGVAAKSLYETQHLLEEQQTDTARIIARLKSYGFAEKDVTDVVANKDLGTKLNVVAPRSGVVVERHAVEGEPVTTTVPLFAIADLDVMWVHLSVYEKNLSQIRLGQRVTFTPDGLADERFEGTVTWISPEVEPKTRTIQVRAEVTNRDRMLRANMFGRGELEIDAPKSRLVVPQAAVQSLRGRHVVFVAQPNHRFELRNVDIGDKSAEHWEVKAGLNAGEQVATTGSYLLKSNLENPDFGTVE